MCPYEDKLTAWLLDDLPPEEHRALTSHLASCASCRAAKEELSHVLTPLRSGLAKDRNRQISPKAIVVPPRRSFAAWLWRSPHEGLTRAAIIAVSFGSLFALISSLYQMAQREAAPAGDVTSIEFRKYAEEAPLPALQPAAEPREAGAASDSLWEEAQRSTGDIALKSAPIPPPEPPAPEAHMPALRRLVRSDGEMKAKEAPADKASTPACDFPSLRAEAPAKDVAKREQGKSARAKPSRPPADLMIQPVRLASLSAPTNTVPTNAVPTNAVPSNAVPSNAVHPIIKRKP